MDAQNRTISAANRVLRALPPTGAIRLYRQSLRHDGYRREYREGRRLPTFLAIVPRKTRQRPYRPLSVFFLESAIPGYSALCACT